MNLIKNITFFFLMNIALCQKILYLWIMYKQIILRRMELHLHLENGNEIEWLLNYRGGSFLMDNQDNVENTCLVRGVNYEMINSTALSEIFTTIESNNMDYFT